jgi:putative membrane protein
MVTLVTLAVAVAARPEPAWALMTEANVCPSWRRLIRLATGVFALKNASQFFAIMEAAPELATGLAEVAGADEDGAELGLELAPELELLPLLEQAAMPAASAHTSRICWTTLRAIIQPFSNFSPPPATQRTPVHDTGVRQAVASQLGAVIQSWPLRSWLASSAEDDVGERPATAVPGRVRTAISAGEEKQTDASGPARPAPPPAPPVTGGEPDARYTFANERTFLAWMRTALGLVAAGLAIVQLLPPFHGIRWGRHVIGVPLIVLGGVVAVVSYVEWSANQRALRRGDPPRRSWLPHALAVTIALVALVAAVMVLISG